jgi:hypothetical protein
MSAAEAECAHCGQPIEPARGHDWIGPLSLPGEEQVRYHLSPAFPDCRRASEACGETADPHFTSMDAMRWTPSAEAECNGICLTPADLGMPEYGGDRVIAYAHPDCPEHGDPVKDGPELETCSPGQDEDARYVREEDVHGGTDR